MKKLVLAHAVALVAVWIVGVNAGDIVAAPAPLPRAPKPAPTDAVPQLGPTDLCGDWSFTWGGSKWDLSLLPCGTSRCRAPGAEAEWLGTWYLDGGGRLVIEERRVGPDGPGASWQWYVDWHRDKAGLLSRGRPAGQARWAPDGRAAAAIALERRR